MMGMNILKAFMLLMLKKIDGELLDLKPFSYIEGIKNGDWKVLRNSGKNTYYEWYEGKYEDDGSIVGEVNDDGSIASNSYPHWVKKTSDDWKTRIGKSMENMWKLGSIIQCSFILSNMRYILYF
jgi:hypothetical protein